MCSHARCARRPLPPMLLSPEVSTCSFVRAGVLNLRPVCSQWQHLDQNVVKVRRLSSYNPKAQSEAGCAATAGNAKSGTTHIHTPQHPSHPATGWPPRLSHEPQLSWLSLQRLRLGTNSSS